MIKENTLEEFIQFIRNIKDKFKNCLPNILIEYSKNILNVIKYGLILCVAVIFAVLVLLLVVGSICLITSLTIGSPAFRWYFAVSPVILILSLAGLLTAEKYD